MGKVPISLLMATNTMENTGMASLMDKGFTLGLMVVTMKANLRMVLSMVKVNGKSMFFQDQIKFLLRLNYLRLKP